ncbi:MAG: hypothetical protein WC829_06910 [Hyphomicrobium sp.]
MGEIRVVFDGPPGPVSGRFVEVETPDGRSINTGEWVERPDELWELRITQLPPPVHGYRPQSEAKVALVNEFKADEERLLRKIDALFEECFRDAELTVAARPSGMSFAEMQKKYPPPYSDNMLRQATEHLVVGFMLLNRAVFQPQRIALPEDEPKVDEALKLADLP